MPNAGWQRRRPPWPARRNRAGRRLGPGDPLPTLVQESPANPRFVVDTPGGRWLVLAVPGSTAAPGAAALVEAILARGDCFVDSFASALAVTCDPSDRAQARLANRPPGFRVLGDLDLSVARALGAAPQAPDTGPILPRVVVTDPTRMERHLVGCCDAAEGGHFTAPRDNTTAGTAHRRFAVPVNLNDDFEGGAVSFPEYGPEGFRAPAGGAVVFSCSLLHAVSPVTAGRRHAFLSFLCDDAAAQVRDRNRHLVAGAEPGAGTQAAG